VGGGGGGRAMARACQISCGGSPARLATTMPIAMEPPHPRAPGVSTASMDEEEAGSLPLPTPVSPGS
jgi:hypothetical protein